MVKTQNTKTIKKNIKKKKRHPILKMLFILILIAAAVLAYFYFTPSFVVPQRGEETADLKDTVNILLIGADYNEIGQTEGRSDSIMLVSLNFKTEEIFVMSIPRDTYAEVEGHGKTKINHAFAYGGMELLLSSVENLLNIPIDYYAATNFAGFEQVIDAMGGIDIEVDKDMDYQTYYDHIQLEKGFQHLDGKQALQFVRYRQDALGDIKRVERQQLFMQAVIDKMTSFSGMIALPSVISAAFDIIDTDLAKSDIMRIALNVITWDLTDLQTETLPGNFAEINGLSYWQPDKEKLDALLRGKIYREE